MIQSIISDKNITTVFQGIFDLDSCAVAGYEALTRGPSVSPLHAPEALFSEAEQQGLLAELEALCVVNASDRFKQLALQGRLFVNLSHEILVDGAKLETQIRHLLEKASSRRQQVVIELTERSTTNNVDELISAIRYFRGHGFEIAIDDLGAGYSTLRLWSEIRPDFVKIDRHFVNNIDLDQTKQEFVRSILHIAQSVGTKIIGEGVETRGELEALKRLGVPLVQGYFLERPSEVPEAFDYAKLSAAKSPDEQELHFARSLICSRDCVDSNASVEEVVERFQHNVALNSVTIVEQGVAIGMVHRKRFLTEMSRPFAVDLYGRRSICDRMDKSFLQIDANTRIAQVSKLVTDRARLHAEEDFVVTERGKYAGMGQVIDLLRQITEVQVKTARHANPLTMLPGNVPIADCVERLLGQDQSFVVCYFDLDNFKPFNDNYGYAIGDQVLMMFAEILEKYVHRSSDFIGHIGGDDFIAVSCSDKWLQDVCAVVNEFEERVVQFYSATDQAAGGIDSQDRYGQARFFKYISVSVGALKVEVGDYQSFQEVSAQLVTAKRRSKSSADINIAFSSAGNIRYYSCEQGCSCDGALTNSAIECDEPIKPSTSVA